jgi:rhamnogalacturonyl hydrolase YesR
MTIVPFVLAVVSMGTLAASNLESARTPATNTRASSDLESQARLVANLPGEPQIVSAGGVTRDEQPLLTLENQTAFDPEASAPRIVIVGGLDGNGDAARIVLDAVRWFKTSSGRADRKKWIVSALPMADPAMHGRSRPYAFPPAKGFFDDEEPESRYVWRWVAYQVPDLVVEVRVGERFEMHGSIESVQLPAGSLAAALVPSVDTIIATARPVDGPRLMREVLSRASVSRSTLRSAIIERLARQPQSVARLLAQRYPVEPGMNYIPALAWLNTLRLAAMTNDEQLREKVLRQTEPWLIGQKPLWGDRPQLNAIAGTMIFAEIAKLPVPDREAAARHAATGVALASTEKAAGVAQYGFGWSDDMFLGTVASARLGRPEALDAATRLLVESARRLQRPDGLFNHAGNAPVAWGRGNGFAALGLTETLTTLPVAHHARAAVLDIYRRHMSAMRAHQAPDGMWNQIVDVAGSYREESVTALIVTSMARGVRLGWLDPSYRPVVLRGWRALLAHITTEGTLVDVCTSTGAGPSRRYYLDRAAISGSDDRGGAMALGAAIEIHELTSGN